MDGRWILMVYVRQFVFHLSNDVAPPHLKYLYILMGHC